MTQCWFASRPHYGAEGILECQWWLGGDKRKLCFTCDSTFLVSHAAGTHSIFPGKYFRALAVSMSRCLAQELPASTAFPLKVIEISQIQGESLYPHPMWYQTTQAFVIFHSFHGLYPFCLFSRHTVEISFIPYNGGAKPGIAYVSEKLRSELCSSSLQCSKELGELGWYSYPGV